MQNTIYAIRLVCEHYYQTGLSRKYLRQHKKMCANFHTGIWTDTQHTLAEGKLNAQNINENVLNQ